MGRLQDYNGWIYVSKLEDGKDTEQARACVGQRHTHFQLLVSGGIWLSVCLGM